MGASETVSEYFARVNIVLMKLERHETTTPAREIKRIVLKSLTPRFPNKTSMLAMKGDFNLSELEHGLARVEKLRSDSNRSTPSHALAVAHAGGGQTGTGGGARGRGRQGRRSGGRQDDGRGRHQQGHPRQMHHGQQHQPPAAMSQQSYAWQQQQQQQYQSQFPQSQQLGPHHQQPNPWSSWGRPPHQQRRERVYHQRRPRHRGGDQAHQQRVMCQQCSEEEHFPTDCVITMPAPTPQSYTAPCSGARAAQYGIGAHAAQYSTGAHAAQYSTGAHVAQYGTHHLFPWTSHDSDGQSTSSAYGPPSNQASFAPAQPIPPPVGPPPPPAPPSDSDWSFSSGPSQALQAQNVPPGEFSSSDLTDGGADGDSVGGSYLPSAFVGQPVGIDQVNDVWIGDSGATTHMTRNADMMYDTRPPSPHRSTIILGDGSIRKVQFVGKLDMVFHTKTTDHPVTLDDVSFVPDLGFNLFSFHVVQQKHEIILNKTGAHLLNGRLVFPRRSNRSSMRATRVMPGVHASASNALATFADPPSPLQYRSVASPVAHETSSASNSCWTSNAGAGMGGKSSIVAAWKKGEESASVSSGNDGIAAAVLSPGGLILNKNKKE